ncbi:DUF4837 family protein [Pararhodonellum marinum]|uniref:DUF4837 family protein n=1 Tax=Pararhodonellum marinum TaxID=2755358 RepID=UPI00188FD4AA|nr:DUF4837 family protein [Pararhodonellum marinum]
MSIKKQNLPFLFLLLFSFFLVSCEEENGESASSTKPKARGAIGEIVLAIDSAKWNGPVGETLKDIFQDDVKGIIRDESIFSIRRVDPRAMTRILRMATNIVFVTTFDDKKPGSQNINAQFSADAKEKARNDQSLYMLRSEDEFARGQEVVYLFGNTEEELIANLEKNKSKIQNLFQVRERERLSKVILNRKNSAARVMAREKFGIELLIPASYQLAKEDDDFMWLRQPTPSSQKPDLSIFVYMTDYNSEEQVFPESIISLRNSITKKHIFGDPGRPDSFIVIENQIPPVFNNFNIDGKFAVEMRGSWRTNSLSMGGSFISYVVIDSEAGKLYFLDGFVYYPNESHRESLREIETILLATDITPDLDVAS